jgi:hypothetical protein
MGSTASYRVVCLSEALSPITHMAGTEGNEAVIMREAVTSDGSTRWVPALSGNALRHRSVRAPGAEYLLDAWGAKVGNLSQLNMLFHGGQRTEKGGRVSLKEMAELRETVPLLGLLGCSLPHHIVPGQMDCYRGTLVCRENAGRIRELLPGWTVPDGLRSAESFVAPYQYTRGDVANSRKELLPDGHNDMALESMMIFAGQAVMAGSLFVHGYQLHRVTQLELGAFLLSLRLWQEQGGTIGGQASRGHGQLKTWLAVLADVDHEAAVAAYVVHVERAKDSALEMLDRLYRVTRPAPALPGL